MTTSDFIVPRKIMIIDDDPFSVLLSRMKLKKFADEKDILEFYDINDALNYLTQQYSKETAVIPELILLEVLMKNSTGWDFIEQYERKLLNGEIAKSQLVILTSSQFFSDYRRASRNKCVNGFMMKPLQISTLLDIFKNASGGNQLVNNTLFNSFVV